MPHIFLDESGQFTKYKDEKYFVIGTFTIGNPRRTEKQFRVWQRTRFPRKFRYQPEIKFSKIKISDGLRLRTLKFISDLDVRIHYSYFLKSNIPEEYRKRARLKSGLLYANVVGETLEMYLPISDRELRLFCDERHLKGIKRSEFKKFLEARLYSQLPSGTAIQIEMLNSINSPNIQIADWISGVIAWYLEKKRLGEECFQILKNNLLGEGKELFKGYWENKYKNKNPN